MRPDTRDKIIAKLEKAVVFTGATDYDSAMAQFGKLLQGMQEHYHPMRSKSDLSALLDTMPEPSWLEMRFLLGTLQYLPQLLRYGVKRLGESIEDDDDFPQIPRGRPGLDAFSKAQIVAHVGRRHTQGYTLDQAKESAARKFRVSESTVQRAWDDRGNRDAVDFRSVLKYLAAGEKDESDFLNASNESN